MKFNDFLIRFNYDCDVCIYDADTIEILYQGNIGDISTRYFEGYFIEGIYNGSNGFDGMDIAIKKNEVNE